MARRQYGTGSVYKRGDGKWAGVVEAGWTRTGSRRRLTVTYKPPAGTSDKAARAEIQRRLRDKQRQVESGTGGETRAAANVKTWAEQWLEHTQHHLRPKSWATNQSTVNRWVIPTIGHKRLDRLTPGDIRAVTTAMRQAGRSSSSAERAHTMLLRMLREATVEGHPVPQRVLLVTAPARAVNERGAIPLPDALALLKAASTQPDGSRWAAALLQGMRQGECLGLTWDSVDLERGTVDVSWQLQALPYVSGRSGRLRIPDGYEHRQLAGALCLVRPKTARGQRVIPLVPWMADALTRWQHDAPESPHGLVWPADDGSPQTSPTDRAAWYALQDDAGVAGPDGRRYLLHEARHTVATLLLEAGVDPEVIKAILGHSSIVTSRSYMHVDQALTRQALADVARALELER